MLAQVGVSLLLSALVLVLIANLFGYGLSVVIFRSQGRRAEQIADRAAQEAVRLAIETLRGERPCPPRGF